MILIVFHTECISGQVLSLYREQSRTLSIFLIDPVKGVDMLRRVEQLECFAVPGRRSSCVILAWTHGLLWEVPRLVTAGKTCLYEWTAVTTLTEKGLRAPRLKLYSNEFSLPGIYRVTSYRLSMRR